MSVSRFGPTSLGGPIALGIAAGVGVGVVGLGTGAVGTAAAVGVVLSFGFVKPRFAMLAGGLLGTGATWLALTGSLARLCSEAADFCGQANALPWLAGGLTFAVIGLALLVGTLVRARRARDPSMTGPTQPPPPTGPVGRL
jgi:hypothetical protein